MSEIPIKFYSRLQFKLHLLNPWLFYWILLCQRRLEHSQRNRIQVWPLKVKANQNWLVDVKKHSYRKTNKSLLIMIVLFQVDTFFIRSTITPVELHAVHSGIFICAPEMQLRSESIRWMVSQFVATVATLACRFCKLNWGGTNNAPVTIPGWLCTGKNKWFTLKNGLFIPGVLRWKSSDWKCNFEIKFSVCSGDLQLCLRFAIF